MELKVANGKYTFCKNTIHWWIDRYGDDWIGKRQDGMNAIHSLMAELEAARVVLGSARRTVAAAPDSLALMPLREALATHDSLVDVDLEKVR